MKLRHVAGVLVAIFVIAVLAEPATAQRKKKAPDKSQGATVSQTIGVDTEVTIVYHRPSLRGRDVWTDSSANANIGLLVPRNENPRPWRAGANEATTIEFSSDVLVEGQPLAAGKYALFMIPTDGDWTVVFSKQSRQWGSFRYKKDDDALRVNVTPEEAPAQETLMYGFDSPDDSSATAYLHWEHVKVPFTIEVADKPSE